MLLKIGSDLFKTVDTASSVAVLIDRPASTAILKAIDSIYRDVVNPA